MNIIALLLASTLTIWDYPIRQPQHESLRSQLYAATKRADAKGAIKICRKALEILPCDATWSYNLACALTRDGEITPALDALEDAIDFGFRQTSIIMSDLALKPLSNNPRFVELLKRAEDIKDKPIITPLTMTIPAEGKAGKNLTLGAQNLSWDLNRGCFIAKINLITNEAPFSGVLYVNRDQRHSMLTVTNYPGLTCVSLDKEGQQRGADLDFPNTSYPYPVFGNISRAMVTGPYWRSLPRAMMTTVANKISLAHHFYLSNQIWVIPAVSDYDFSSTNSYGDVFSSVAPYWLVTQGKSWSDQYYLRAALTAFESMRADVREELIARGNLAPTIQMLIRRSLKNVESEADYFTSKAHPTALPPNGLNIARLKKLSSALRLNNLPPLATIAAVNNGIVLLPSKVPELTYFSPCACAFILRAEDSLRSFDISASGGNEIKFAIVHDENKAAKLKEINKNTTRITIDRSKMSATNRVDLAIFARNESTVWSAPSFVSFAIVDETAPYSDPALTIKARH